MDIVSCKPAVEGSSTAWPTCGVVQSGLFSQERTGQTVGRRPPTHCRASLVPHPPMNEAPDPDISHPRISPALWGIIALMVVSVAINYIDRVSLSTAAPLLRKEMAIPPEKMG